MSKRCIDSRTIECSAVASWAAPEKLEQLLLRLQAHSKRWLQKLASPPDSVFFHNHHFIAHFQAAPSTASDTNSQLSLHCIASALVFRLASRISINMHLFSFVITSLGLVHGLPMALAALEPTIHPRQISPRLSEDGCCFIDIDAVLYCWKECPVPKGSASNGE